MKRRMVVAGVFAAALFLCIFLSACAAEILPEPTAEELLADLTAEFSSRGSVYVDVSVYRDGQPEYFLSGTVDKTAKRILLNGETDYLYANKYLLCDYGEGFVVEKSDTTYAETLLLLPFSMYDFTYSAKNRNEIYRSGNHIIVTFLNRGVKNTFSSSLTVSGGVFSITFDGSKITETVLTTTLTENGKDYRYSLHYVYSDGGSAFDDMPEVVPTNSLYYMQYALEAISAVHGYETLHVASNGYDTGVMIGSVVTDETKISEVFVIYIDGVINLNVVYSEKVMVVGLSSAISEIQITYDSAFRVSTVTVNAGTKYYLS